jgi:hypothetical protein
VPAALQVLQRSALSGAGSEILCENQFHIFERITVRFPAMGLGGSKCDKFLQAVRVARATLDSYVKQSRDSGETVCGNLYRAITQNRLDAARTHLAQLTKLRLQESGHSRVVQDMDYLAASAEAFARGPVTQEHLNAVGRLRAVAECDGTGYIKKALKVFPSTPKQALAIPRDIQMLFKGHEQVTQADMAQYLPEFAAKLQLPVESLEAVAGVRANPDPPPVYWGPADMGLYRPH